MRNMKLDKEIRSCLNCKHFFKDRFGKCKAFPDGIPFAIVSGQEEHINKVPGDNGIRFEPIEEANA